MFRINLKDETKKYSNHFKITFKYILTTRFRTKYFNEFGRKVNIFFFLLNNDHPRMLEMKSLFKYAGNHQL